VINHPSGEQRFRRLLQNLLPEGAQLAAEIRHMFELGDLEVPQGAVGTFAQIF
jgi:hypothetical protein